MTTKNTEAYIIEDERTLAVTYKPSVLEANFDALEAHVRQTVGAYEGAIYDLTIASNVKEAKNDRSYLNGLKKEIDERRKAVKREYNKPLDAFEKRCKQITSIIDGAVDNIKQQLDQAEQERQDRVYAKLQEHYEEFAGLLAPVVPYERFHEKQWLNKTFGEIKAYEALEAKVSKLAVDWKTLKSQLEGEPYCAEAERELFATLDLGVALTVARKAEEDNACIAELKTAMEPEPVTEQIFESVDNTPEVKSDEPVANQQTTPCVMVINSATVEQMKAIGQFCGSIGVTGVFKRGTLQQVCARMNS